MVGRFFNTTKIYLILYIGIIFSTLSCKSVYEPYAKRILNNKEFKHRFYVIDKKPHPRLSKTYYWFKTQNIHNSKGDYGGKLLDGPYIKYYINNQIAEKGSFKNGIKTGVWNTWYTSGQLAITERWRHGIQSGKHIQYDSLGIVISKGKYKHGKKARFWIYPKTGDTIFYKKGERFSKDKDTNDVNFLKRLFTKEEKLKGKKSNKKNTKQNQNNKKSLKKKGNENDKKVIPKVLHKIGTFFKQMYHKIIKNNKHD